MPHLSTPTPPSANGPAAAVFASPADTAVHGEYRIATPPSDAHPLYRFDARIGVDLPAEPGRYHLYAGWFCPWAQRVVITLALAGLTDAVSVSYVHGQRDGRGWAFREETGADPVNGFPLLRDVYEATEPGFDGHLSVPALWDRVGARVVSNRFDHLDADLATAFAEHRSRHLYPPSQATRIDELEAWLLPALNHGVGAARQDATARDRLSDTLGELDEILATSRFLAGPEVTLADARVIPTLLRYDAQANVSAGGGSGAIGRALPEYPNLWRYAREVYQLPGVAATTDFSAFTTPGADVPDWSEPVG